MLTASLMRWRGMGETKAEAAGAHDDEADIPMIVAGGDSLLNLQIPPRPS